MTKVPDKAMKDAARLCALIAIGWLAGLLANWLHVPLAWMIGPIVVTAILTLWLDLPAPPVAARYLGQLVVGGAVGLYLTPEALDRIIQNGPVIVVSAVVICVIASAVGIAQVWYGGMNPATAIYSAVPGGPLEMANQAERHGGDPARAALAQTMRIFLVVIIFPPLLILASDDLPPLPAATGGWIDTLVLIAIALAVGLIARKIRFSNPFFLGPMIAIGALVASGIQLPSHHAGVIPAAQILLGISLGSMFRRSLLAGARAFLLVSLANIGFLLVVSLGVSAAFTHLVGGSFATMALGNAPGAVTEMAITAKVLQLDVPLVAGFQFVRILISLMIASIAFRIARLRRRR